MTGRKVEAVDFANRMEGAQLDGKSLDWNDSESFGLLEGVRWFSLLGGALAYRDTAARACYLRRARTRRQWGVPSGRWPKWSRGTVSTVKPAARRSSRTGPRGKVR